MPYRSPYDMTDLLTAAAGLAASVFAGAALHRRGTYLRRPALSQEDVLVCDALGLSYREWPAVSPDNRARFRDQVFGLPAAMEPQP